MLTSVFFDHLAAARPRLLPESLVIGRPLLAGEVDYDPRAQSYRLAAGGENMWGTNDEGHLAGRRFSGDGLVRARAEFIGTGGHAHRKLGLTFRAGVDAGAPHVSAVMHADGLISLQFRLEAGAKAGQRVSPVIGADVFQLERRGRVYVMRVARFGEVWTDTVLEEGPDLGQEALVGLFLCSHEATVREEAVFRDVRLLRPATPAIQPYSDYLPSEMEILNPETGYSRVIWRNEGEMQAPNWSPDGTTIDTNRGGLIHRLDLSAAAEREVPTGAIRRNNNDHVLSPDGAWIGLSHRTDGENGVSLVHVVPAAGGEPRVVTPRGPSYLHGWSPDGRELLYIARREGTAFNVYRAPVDGSAEETRLSDGPSLDDGAEYSPDGAWIYFNSDRTGRMKIWRMRADGSGTEAVTTDELNDWFPHVSPDGRWLVFISYEPEVPAREHPFYKQVYLRRMPIEGGAPRVMSYVYGGQGTFNVPAWSPDGAWVVLVSNGGVGGY